MRALSTTPSPRTLHAFAERLQRAGVAVPPAQLLLLTRHLDPAATRPAVLAAADAMLQALTGAGIACSKSKLLEAIAAARGARSWAALDAVLPRPSAPAVPGATAARIEEQADRLGGLIWLDYGTVTRRGVPSWECGWLHPEDCRPEARRILLKLGIGEDRAMARVAVVEGFGRSLRVLAEVVTHGGRKEAEWEANILAERWLTAPPPAATPEEQSERNASRLLCQAGFCPELLGQAHAWVRRADPRRFTLYNEEDGRERVSLAGPVVLEVVEEGWDEEESYAYRMLSKALTKAAALELEGPHKGAPGLR